MNIPQKSTILTQLDSVIVGKSLRRARLRGLPALRRTPAHRRRAGRVGKTTLAHALAATFGCSCARAVHADLLPSDLTGVSVYERGSSQGFVFHPGPVFTQVLLADEINRASPKTERPAGSHGGKQVSVEGERAPCPSRFRDRHAKSLDQLGTYPPCGSQLDRFLMRISLGYPDRAAERARLLSPVATGASNSPPARRADGR